MDGIAPQKKKEVPLGWHLCKTKLPLKVFTSKTKSETISET